MNIGRGNTVVEQDLIRALKENVIAGAALDVFYEEPLSEKSELWDIPNVLMTPHCADWLEGFEVDVMEIFMDNLDRFDQGKTLRNICDKRKGY